MLQPWLGTEAWVEFLCVWARATCTPISQSIESWDTTRAIRQPTELNASRAKFWPQPLWNWCGVNIQQFTSERKQCCSNYLSWQTALTVQRPLKPSTPAKRSNPLFFTPPKGSDWFMYVVAKSLIVVIPACKRYKEDVSADTQGT